MDWSSYEAIVKHIYETLGGQFGVKVECFGRNCKCTGKTGVEHQIDVLLSHSDGIHTYKTAVECKYWNQKVNKDVVMKISEIVEDCGFNKGVIVSKKGFTQDAITYARSKGIGLVELREPTDEDWKGRIRRIEIKFHILEPDIAIALLLPEEEKDKAGRSSKADPHLVYLVYPDGKEISMIEIIGRFIQNLSLEEEKEETINFPPGTLIVLPNEQLKIQGIRLRGKLRKGATKTLEINGEDVVFLIMKELFEGKKFIVDRGLNVREVKN